MKEPIFVAVQPPKCEGAEEQPEVAEGNVEEARDQQKVENNDPQPARGVCHDETFPAHLSDLPVRQDCEPGGEAPQCRVVIEATDRASNGAE